MGLVNIVLWVGGRRADRRRLHAGAGPVGALPGAQGAGRQRRPLRGVARRRPRRRHDRRLGRDGDPAPPGPDRRPGSRSPGSSSSSSGSSSADAGRRLRRQPPADPAPCSIAVQRSITTARPPSWAIRGRLPVDDAELEPQAAGAGRDRLAGMRRRTAPSGGRRRRCRTARSRRPPRRASGRRGTPRTSRSFGLIGTQS